MSAAFYQLELWLEDPFLLFGVMFILAVANLFFPPLPLETATIFAGYLSGTGRGSLIAIIAATTLGMFTGSIILYILAEKYGNRIIFQTPLRKVITRKSYEKAACWFEKYGLAAVFLGKLVPGMSLYTVISCGVLGWPVSRAAPAFGVSNLLFFGLLALLGRTAGRHWSRILETLRHINQATLLLAGVALVVLAVIKIRSRRRERNR